MSFCSMINKFRLIERRNLEGRGCVERQQIRVTVTETRCWKWENPLAVYFKCEPRADGFYIISNMELPLKPKAVVKLDH